MDQGGQLVRQLQRYNKLQPGAPPRCKGPNHIERAGQCLYTVLVYYTDSTAVVVVSVHNPPFNRSPVAQLVRAFDC